MGCTSSRHHRTEAPRFCFALVMHVVGWTFPDLVQSKMLEHRGLLGRPIRLFRQRTWIGYSLNCRILTALFEGGFWNMVAQARFHSCLILLLPPLIQTMRPARAASGLVSVFN